MFLEGMYVLSIWMCKSMTNHQVLEIKTTIRLHLRLNLIKPAHDFMMYYVVHADNQIEGGSNGAEFINIADSAQLTLADGLDTKHAIKSGTRRVAKFNQDSTISTHPQGCCTWFV